MEAKRDEHAGDGAEHLRDAIRLFFPAYTRHHCPLCDNDQYIQAQFPNHPPREIISHSSFRKAGENAPTSVVIYITHNNMFCLDARTNNRDVLKTYVDDFPQLVALLTELNWREVSGELMRQIEA